MPEEGGGLLQPQGPGPFLEDNGDDTWVCGKCGRVLCCDMNDTVLVEDEVVAPVVMQCPDCGVGNEIPTS